MLYWALVFLLVALVAGALGFGGVPERLRYCQNSLFHFPRAAFGFACDSLHKRCARSLDKGAKPWPRSGIAFARYQDDMQFGLMGSS
jgi:hypothetical protein